MLCFMLFSENWFHLYALWNPFPCLSEHLVCVHFLSEIPELDPENIIPAFQSLELKAARTPWPRREIKSNHVLRCIIKLTCKSTRIGCVSLCAAQSLGFPSSFSQFPFFFTLSPALLFACAFLWLHSAHRHGVLLGSTSAWGTHTVTLPLAV